MSTVEKVDKLSDSDAEIEEVAGKWLIKHVD